MECSGVHRGHRIFVGGGPLDGHVDHLVYATQGDYPLQWRYPSGALYERMPGEVTESMDVRYHLITLTS